MICIHWVLVLCRFSVSFFFVIIFLFIFGSSFSYAGDKVQLVAGPSYVDSQTGKGGVIQQMPLKVAFTHWPPWKVIKDGKFSGIDADILKTIGERTGITFEFVACPWRRCIELLKNGDVDMITNFGDTPERREYADYIQEPYVTEMIALYKKKGTPVVIEKESDLSKYKIGEISGAIYFPSYDQREDLDKVTVSNEMQLFKMLESRRIDVLIGYESQIDYQVGIDGYSGAFEKCLFKKKGISSFLALTKKRDLTAYNRIIRDTLRAMGKDGTIQSIISSYSGL